MKHFVTFLIGLAASTVVSCSNESNANYERNPTAETVTQAADIPQVSFEAFAEELAPLALPFTAGCSFAFVPSPTADTAAAGHFLKPHELPYRKVIVNKNVVALVVLFPTDEILPRLRTFTPDGRQLDEQDLKFLPCREEPSSDHREQFTIAKDFTITHTDSTTRWQVDAQYNEVPNTRKLTVTRKRFKIQANGQIDEVK
ncbi:hypothetical protein [Rufibacter sp. LB8]|uniref:hypothetical protein n=1 Tax=Rufibacter sp. LB8 TaxID=2777781 RepID=UPI00178C5777|nr:hypothetical protein [Rufibacter sp. LB8]